MIYYFIQNCQSVNIKIQGTSAKTRKNRQLKKTNGQKIRIRDLQKDKQG